MEIDFDKRTVVVRLKNVKEFLLFNCGYQKECHYGVKPETAAYMAEQIKAIFDGSIVFKNESCHKVTHETF